MRKETAVVGIKKIVGWTIFLTALLITPILSFEPINIVKMAALVVGAFSILPLAIALAVLERRIQSLVRVLIGYLVLQTLIFLPVVVSAETLEQAIWGQFGRNNGALSTSALVTLSLGSFLVSREIGSKWIVDSLYLSSFLISGYGTLQLLGWDPIPWSQTGVFSTLGNTNFASAYFALITIVSITKIWELIELGGNVRFAAFWGSLNLVLTVASGSIQGILMVALSLLMLGWFWMISLGSRFAIRLTYVFLVTCSTILVSLGFFAKGPLSFLRQETLFFRLDYWRAGLRMIGDYPLFGLGPDSYGDYYREYRYLDAVLENPGRVTNTAHNVFIDLGVSFGLPVGLFFFILFLGIIIFMFVSLTKTFRNYRNFSDLTILITLITYFAQANISINQIAIAVTGWAFLGANIAWAQNTLQKVQQTVGSRVIESSRRAAKKKAEESLPPGPFLVTLMSGLIGFFLVLPPFRVDIQFNSAIKKSSIDELLPASRKLGATSVHKEVTLDRMKQLAPQVQLVYAKELLTIYPRSFYTWEVVHSLSDVGTVDKSDALKNLRKLDPLNPRILELKE